MRWVKDTLPPRARARWLLMTMRLSHSSLTGTERTLVAVGTVRLRSMFWAVRIGAPRSTVSLGSSLASAGGAGEVSFGTGADVFAGEEAAEELGDFVAGALSADPDPEDVAGALSAGLLVGLLVCLLVGLSA